MLKIWILDMSQYFTFLQFESKEFILCRIKWKLKYFKSQNRIPESGNIAHTIAEVFGQVKVEVWPNKAVLSLWRIQNPVMFLLD